MSPLFPHVYLVLEALRFFSKFAKHSYKYVEMFPEVTKSHILHCTSSLLSDPCLFLSG